MARKLSKALKISSLATGITVVGLSLSPLQGNVEIVQGSEFSNPFPSDQVFFEVPPTPLMGSIVFEEESSELNTDPEKGPSASFEILSTSYNSYQELSGGSFEMRSEIGYDSGSTLSGGDFSLSPSLFPLPEIIQLPGDDLWIIE